VIYCVLGIGRVSPIVCQQWLLECWPIEYVHMDIELFDQL
jgi:hypothetical protein